MKNKILFGGGAFLLACLAIALCYFYYLNAAQQTMLRNDYATASSALASQNPAAAIALSTTALTQTNDPAWRGRFTLLLAESLLTRAQNDDRTSAIQYYKHMVGDQTIPSDQRALALNDVSIFVNNNSLASYQTNFTEAPFNTFVPASGSDVMKKEEAYFAILKLSDETYPTSFAEYSIAGSYYPYLLVYNELGTSTPAQIATLAQQYIAKADARGDQSLYSNYQLLKEYYYRAVALSVSGRILGAPPLAEREAAFQYVLQTAAKLGTTSPNDPSYATVLNARFYYAVMLLKAAPTRTSDIAAILQPFSSVDVSSKNLGVISSLKNASSTDPVKLAALQLAEISPDFAMFLAGLGVMK